MCSVYKAQRLRLTFPHCPCPAVLLSVFTPVALNFGESTCSFIDPLTVEHPLFTLSFNLGILILTGVTSCGSVFLLRIWKKYGSWVISSLCSMLLDHKRGGFKEAYRRIFSGLLFAWSMMKQVAKLEQYERLTSH